MFGIEKLDQAIKEHLGELTPEQEAAIQEMLDKPITEKELFQKLCVPEEKFGKFLRAFHSGKGLEVEQNYDEELFSQELSSEELSAVAAGRGGGCDGGPRYICKRSLYSDIYWDEWHQQGFPNCASTVEDGSWCVNNDACYGGAIIYRNMGDCHKAWR